MKIWSTKNQFDQNVVSIISTDWKFMSRISFSVSTDTPHSNNTIGVTTEKGASISFPGETGAVYHLQSQVISTVLLTTITQMQ